MAHLVYRHNRVTRLTHWINTVALLILIMSGLQIFNAYPHLHWGSKTEPDEAFFSISAMNDDGEIRGYTQFYGIRVDTTGFLGLQNTETGPFPRAFPSWLTIPSYFWLAGGRRWHFFFAWVFVLNGLLYLVFNLFNGHLRKFVCTPKDAAKAPTMILYYLRLRRESPQESEYNPLQKMAYTGIFFILTPLIMLSGLAMSPQMDTAFHWLPGMFGGRQSARSIHFILTFLFVSFTFGHVLMVLTTGVVNNMRSMITGWYREKVPIPMEPPRIEPRVEPSPEVTPEPEAAKDTALEAKAAPAREPNREVVLEPPPIQEKAEPASNTAMPEAKKEEQNNAKN